MLNAVEAFSEISDKSSSSLYQFFYKNDLGSAASALLPNCILENNTVHYAVSFFIGHTVKRREVLREYLMYCFEVI